MPHIEQRPGSVPPVFADQGASAEQGNGILPVGAVIGSIEDQFTNFEWKSPVSLDRRIHRMEG